MSGLRLIDLMCAHHRREVLHTRLWPSRNTDCPACRHYNIRVRLLPDQDIMRCIAVHESGHAVAYLTLGCQVAAVELRPDGTGNVDFLCNMPQPVGVWAGTGALRRMLLNGGNTAEADLFDAAATGGVGANSDAEQLHALAGDGADVRAARDVADALVEARWPVIERVADTLHARGRLTGDDIAAIAAIGVAA